MHAQQVKGYSDQFMQRLSQIQRSKGFNIKPRSTEAIVAKQKQNLKSNSYKVEQFQSVNENNSPSSKYKQNQDRQEYQKQLKDYSDEFQRFSRLAQQGNLVPLYYTIWSNKISPVEAYERIVSQKDRNIPSFLLESVEAGKYSGRYSFVGAHPALEVCAKGNEVLVLDNEKGQKQRYYDKDPFEVIQDLGKRWQPVQLQELEHGFTGGWCGYSGYDSVRYVFPNKIPFDQAPQNDENFNDVHFGLYKNIIVFDNLKRIAYIIQWVSVDEYDSLNEAFYEGRSMLNQFAQQLQQGEKRLQFHQVNLDKFVDPIQRAQRIKQNADQLQVATSKEQYMKNVESAKEYIRAGDIFQVVLSQRVTRNTFAEPFEIYQAMRQINPSTYMLYVQCRDVILVAASPEVLVNIDDDRQITNRPLAGTRRRGKSLEEDKQLEEELLADEKEKSEHIMLVDLGRNDVGRVAKYGSVRVEKFMEIERYSHVMHISSTVKGKLKDELSSWDALKSTLPVGTISGAPKVRAMQIIDELENRKRGPYGGGIGYSSFNGTMDICLALRTLVIPTNTNEALYKNNRREYAVNIQSGAGVVNDSDPEMEYEECMQKALASSLSIDLAEDSFLKNQPIDFQL